MRTLKPRKNHIIIRRIAPKEKIGHITIPSRYNTEYKSTKEVIYRGIVDTVGENVSDVKIDDYVYFGNHQGKELNLSDYKYTFIHIKDVLAKEE